MMFITHDLSVLVEVSDRLAIMYAGKIVEEGRADAVFHRPEAPYTKALAAAFPAIGDDAVPAQAGRASAATRRTPSTSPTGCSFHPRCPRRRSTICATLDPELWDAGAARRAACCPRVRRPAAWNGVGA